MIKEDNLLNQYKEAKRIIQQAMEDKQLVLFVGAGASIASGMPSWSQAIKTIAERLSITDEPLDYFRIPQYYYNARGKKEYTQLMREIFKHGDFLKKHEIHDKIIEFNTDIIITTNYDHLIEQAAEDNSQILSIVSKDADLPYRRGGKELIKMHGDFENDNFVLKEDDYLSYSSNFKLIENYIKSLIGTKVVLFIGYSFNDPDLKLIFSWVKDILGGDFQRAYLIDSSRAYDVNEAEYFRNFGINILYSSIQLSEKYFTDDLSNNLLKMLKWLLGKEREDKLIELYNDLKPFSTMNYASSKYIDKALLKADIFSYDGRIYINEIMRTPDSETSFIFKALAYQQYLRLGKSISVPKEYYKWLEVCEKSEAENFQMDNNRRAAEYFSGFNIPKDKQEYVREIVDVLCKTNLQCIEAHMPKKSHEDGRSIVVVPFLEYDCFNWMGFVNTFNLKALGETANKNALHLTDTRPELYMEQGYIQFILCNYMDSYTCFKNAKSIYYKRKEYVRFFIAEFNRYILGRMITLGSATFRGISLEDVDAVKEEMESIDLDRMFNSLPDLGESNKALKDIYTFNVAYTLFQDAYNTSEKVYEQAKTRYYLFSGTAAFAGMRRNINDYYNYISLNLLPVNEYSEHINIFRIYFQSIINSVLTKDKNNEIDVRPSKNIHANELQPFDILIALKFVSESVIAKNLEGISSELPLSVNTIEYLSEVIGNCDQSVMKTVYKYNNPFWKCLIFLGYSKLYSGLVDATLQKVNELIAPAHYRNYDNLIIRFIKNADEQGVISDQGISYLESFLEKELIFLAKNRVEADSHCGLVISVLWTLNNRGIFFDRVDYITPLFDNDSRIFVVSLYNRLGNKCKTEIYEAYRGWSFERNVPGYEFYYYLVYMGIIKPDADAEKSIFEYYRRTARNTSSTNDIMSFPHKTEEDFIYKLLELFLENLILNKEACRNLITEYNLPGAEWLMNYDDFDYSLFDVNWLKICTDNLLSKICKKSTVKNKIKRAVEQKYRLGEVERKILDLYFRYLV